MRLKSAREDFEANTLGAVPGLLGKLSYISQLSDNNGAYSHWGLERLYGNDAARHAISAVHRTLLSKILKAPLRVLLDDVAKSCSNQQLTEGEFLFSLNAAHSLPESPPPASTQHLKSVLHALLALAENRNRANPQGA